MSETAASSIMKPTTFQGLTLLGSSNAFLPMRPEDAKLERFPNPRGGDPRYSVTFHCTEFTSLCPITAAPDFGTLEIEYSPRLWCLESKSLKLYLGAFRETGAFWEALTNQIALHLDEFLRPHWIIVTATMNVRGGIGMTCYVPLGDIA